jgi:hypothetical protein
MGVQPPQRQQTVELRDGPAHAVVDGHHAKTSCARR